MDHSQGQSFLRIVDNMMKIGILIKIQRVAMSSRWAWAYMNDVHALAEQEDNSHSESTKHYNE